MLWSKQKRQVSEKIDHFREHFNATILHIHVLGTDTQFMIGLSSFYWLVRVEVHEPNMKDMYTNKVEEISLHIYGNNNYIYLLLITCNFQKLFMIHCFDFSEKGWCRWFSFKTWNESNRSVLFHIEIFKIVLICNKNSNQLHNNIILNFQI